MILFKLYTWWRSPRRRRPAERTERAASGPRPKKQQRSFQRAASGPRRPGNPPATPPRRLGGRALTLPSARPKTTSFGRPPGQARVQTSAGAQHSRRIGRSQTGWHKRGWHKRGAKKCVSAPKACECNVKFHKSATPGWFPPYARLSGSRVGDGGSLGSSRSGVASSRADLPRLLAVRGRAEAGALVVCGNLLQIDFLSCGERDDSAPAQWVLSLMGT